MRAFNVSDNIGFDGETYYCRRCGKDGYARATQVRGHLALCPGTLARKGVPTSEASVLALNSSVQEITGSFFDGDGLEYAFSLRYWRVQKGVTKI